MELKRILRQYIFTLIIIMCIGFLFSGIVTVREKTQFNMDMTPYETVNFEDNCKNFNEIVKKFLTQTIYGDNIS